jgi:hypothetical protein
MRNLSSGLNAQFRATEVVNHPFYSIGPKMMFESVSEHFIIGTLNMQNLSSGLNALFRGNEVVKHAIYSIVMFGSVWSISLTFDR